MANDFFKQHRETPGLMANYCPRVKLNGVHAGLLLCQHGGGENGNGLGNGNRAGVTAVIHNDSNGRRTGCEGFDGIKDVMN